MNEEEKEKVRLFIESKMNKFHFELPSLDRELEAEFVLNHLLSEYHLVPKQKKHQYYMVIHDDCNPACDDCFNAFGWCGTPCVNCDQRRTFDDSYEMFMYVPGKFEIYKRKEFS